VAGRKGEVRRIALEPDDDADAAELEGGKRDASLSEGGVDKGEKGEAGGESGDGDANWEETAAQVDAGGDADARGSV
jgi:hypothetical protein